MIFSRCLAVIQADTFQDWSLLKRNSCGSYRPICSFRCKWVPSCDVPRQTKCALFPSKCLLLCQQPNFVRPSPNLLPLLVSFCTNCCTFQSFEMSTVTLKLLHSKVIFDIYRPPSSPAKSRDTASFSQFLEDFRTLMSSISTTPYEFLITGDLHSCRWSYWF